MKKIPIFIPLALVVFASQFHLKASEKDQVQELLKQGRVHFFDSNYADALQSFEKALAVAPQNLEAQLGRMDALGALRQPIDSLAKSASSKQTSPSEALILGANEKIWKRQFDEALADLNQAIEKDSNSYLGHFLAAFLHRRSRNFDQALVHLQKAFTIAPNFPETSYLMGEVYLAQGKTDEALRAFQRYLELVPKKGKRFDSVSATLARIGGR